MFKTKLADMTMKIAIPGGTGQVGTLLARAFHRDGHEVVVLSRFPKAAPWRVVRWDPADQKDWPAEIDGADVVINLAGRSVNCRYTRKNKDEILQSRVSSVKAVGRAIREAKLPPAVWLQMSTATIYAHRYNSANDEVTGMIGGTEPGAPAAWRFSIDVATAWERALVGLPAWTWMLEIAAFFHRTETELLLKSRRVVPRRLLEDGFAFQYPEWSGAANALCRRRKMEGALRRRIL